MFARSGQLLSAWAAVRWKDVLLSTLVSKDEHVITFLNNSATPTNHAYCSTEPYLRHDTLHALIFFSMPGRRAYGFPQHSDVGTMAPERVYFCPLGVM